MIPSMLNGMVSIMLAKFMLNDVPHALGIVPTIEDKEQIAAAKWKEVLKYCHSADDLRKIASGKGVIKLYHGAPTEYAELMVKQGPSVPYKVEDTARYVANLYGIPWLAYYRVAHRRHEVVEKLSTATAPVAARWAWSFTLGEILTDLNAHARFYLAYKKLATEKRISLDAAHDQLYNEAIEIGRQTGQRVTTDSALDVLGLPNKLILKSGTGALIEVTVDASILSHLGTHDARSFLEDVDKGEMPMEEALLFWNHNYRDYRINPDDILSMKIVVRNMKPWEQDVVEELVKAGKLSSYCGGIGTVAPPATGSCYRDSWKYIAKNLTGTLVHGTIVGLSGRLNHAWVELPDGTVWDPAGQGTMLTERYYSLVDPIVDERYTVNEALHMLSVGKHGPWTAAERMKHIGR